MVAASEGRKLEQINLATGAREAAIAQSEGEKQAEINKAEGQAAATIALANATAEALERIAAATQKEGGLTAVNLQVAEKYVAAFSELARTNNTLIVPGNMSDMSTLIASAMKIVDSSRCAAPVLTKARENRRSAAWKNTADSRVSEICGVLMCRADPGLIPGIQQPVRRASKVNQKRSPCFP